MLASSRLKQPKRRGIVLVLILGVLALLAIIGVTFATFTGQTRVGARSFAQSVQRPLNTDLMDFALSQLIGDTADVRSAIRGHSMARDMYGNDAASNGYLAFRPGGAGAGVYNYSFFYVVNYQQVASSNLFDILTNIRLDDPAFYGFNFTRWVMRITYTGPNPPNGPNLLGTYGKPVDQTFEVVFDNNDPNNSLGSALADGVHRVLRVNPADGTTVLNNPTMAARLNLPVGPPPAVWTSIPAPPQNLAVLPFSLDGRYLRAFNGPGMGQLAVNANFRYNGQILGQSNVPNSPGEPNMVGMDEDYDASDLENWFLAIQSADGQVVVPSFHRPGIIRYTLQNGVPGAPSDWNTLAVDSQTRILRPRGVDHTQFATSFPDPVPDPTTGQITFDVDNDGDGVNDSVWVDLGYPARTDERGQLYKPLFAFMVIGLNGRMPLNTAGNIAGANHTSASHLGNSPSELDPTYALQNAYGGAFSQVDNASVDVRLTQLRNLLTGTRPNASPHLQNQDPINNPAYTDRSNGDLNWVLLDGLQYYMPNGQYDPTPAFLPADFLNGVDPLTGNPAVVRNTQAVAGRWGEGDIVQSIIPTTTPGWANHVRAGLSRGYSYPTPGFPTGFPRDADDDNYNTFDAFPAGHQGEVGDEDWYDASGGLILPVERNRRFVTPMDINGTGKVATFATSPNPATRGGDAWGRVAFFSYFRPPGLPGIIDTNPANVTVGAIGSFLASPLRGVDVTPLNRKATDAASDTTNNPTHGYDFFRFPTGTNTQQFGAMPYDQPGSPPTGKTIPTYDLVVNGGQKPPSDGLDDADEMNLYQADGLDAPFGLADLEWLYRSQDVDGAQLSSRLRYLAPISFTDKNSSQGDGLRHRRLFSIDTWERNNFVWANDNPQVNVGGVWTTPFGNNSRFVPAANADFANLNITGGPPATSDITKAAFQAYPWLQFLGPFLALQTPPVSPTNTGAAIANDPVPHWPVPSPSISHREKKINLNFPLPVSNDPNEPIRHKWIRETYQLLKTILPPKAVDTPEELAQLSQYVVNIVDFRDPDGTITRFVNPDVIMVLGSVTPPPTSPLPTVTGVTNSKLDYTANSGLYGANTWMPLEQFGMEYNPIAINESIGYQFDYASGGTPPNVTIGTTYRFLVELASTLTQAAVGTSTTLDLSNWDIVITNDDPVSRPDPFTGQLLPIASAYYIAQIPLTSAGFTGAGATSVIMPPIPTAGLGTPPPNYYYVIGNAAAPNSENAPLTGTQTLQPQFDPTTAGSNPPTTAPTTLAPGFYVDPGNPNLTIGKTPNQYPQFKIPMLGKAKAGNYWICLRRPANPFQTPNPANTVANPMVVVDCMRFTMTESGGVGSPNGTVTTTPTTYFFSTQRTQPYRGGHAVSPAFSAAASTMDTRYGFTEQAAAPPTTSVSTNYGYFYTNDAAHQITGLSGYKTNNTLGFANSPADPAWDYLPFHDRDFTSVAELLLVPGCPPGLFTKQFAELAPTNTTPFSPPCVPPTNPPAAFTTRPVAGSTTTPGMSAATLFTAGTPHTFPYLVDNFFYTSPSPGAGTPAMYGDRMGAGWFKMFEFFEVPSQADGSYAPLAQGTNFDWARQDLRPGLLNLNLIMDDEVLLGLLGQQNLANFNQLLLNFTPMTPNLPWTPLTPLAPDHLPRVVTSVDANGTPLTSYEIGSQGHVYPPTSPGLPQSPFVKAAFAQFLKVRHGGSGFLFAYGSGPTGTPNNTLTPANLAVASDRPFRSLSFPDIDFTVMRPAALAPSNYSLPAHTSPGTVPPGPYASDPGLRNPYLYPGYATGVPPSGLSVNNKPPWYPSSWTVPPAIPTRRLFQNPDFYASSNASETGDPYINIQSAGAGTPTTGSLGAPTNNTVNLVSPVPIPGVAPAPTTNPYLGSGGATDGGQLPYYRTEMLQRVMNLTTVRTHQYAVWITVGFFRVLRQGDPSLAYSAPTYLGYDNLGKEVGLPGGQRTRYRAFFIVDRSKLTGFDPSNPGNYRDAVLYRQNIQ
jgi:hypothetical protein